jgi:APA family basic amino acid/polyamine antiporter
VQNLAVLAKLAGILWIVILGAGVGLGWIDAPAGPDQAAPATAPRAGSWAAALIGIVFSYGGWQNVTAAAAEVRRPQHTLPLGILCGTAGVVLVYVALNASLVGLLGVEGLAATSTPVASAALSVAPFSGPLVAGMIALSAAAILQALLMLAPRIFYAMAVDGVFFRSAARLHATWRTPWVAIAILGGAGIAHVFLVGQLGSLLEITTQGDAVFFCLCGVALFVLRRTRPELPRPYRAHGYPWLPAIFLIFSGAMVVNVALHASGRVLVLVALLFAVGWLLYLRWSR